MYACFLKLGNVTLALAKFSTANLFAALRKQAYLPCPSVWTRKAGHVQVNSVLPLLFPWKRQALGRAVRAGRFKALPKAKKGSLLFVIR